MYMIYSPNEAATSGGAGYWSPDIGWTDDPREAKVYSEADKAQTLMPKSLGGDACFVPAEGYPE